MSRQTGPPLVTSSVAARSSRRFPCLILRIVGQTSRPDSSSRNYWPPRATARRITNRGAMSGVHSTQKTLRHSRSGMTTVTVSGAGGTETSSISGKTCMAARVSTRSKRWLSASGSPSRHHRKPRRGLRRNGSVATGSGPWRLRHGVRCGSNPPARARSDGSVIPEGSTSGFADKPVSDTFRRSTSGKRGPKTYTTSLRSCLAASSSRTSNTVASHTSPVGDLKARHTGNSERTSGAMHRRYGGRLGLHASRPRCCSSRERLTVCLCSVSAPTRNLRGRPGGSLVSCSAPALEPKASPRRSPATAPWSPSSTQTRPPATAPAV